MYGFFPVVLIIGGIVTVLISNEKNIWTKVKLTPPWRYFIAFLWFAILGIILSIFTKNIFVHLFESFYRYGYLVIGGG